MVTLFINIYTEGCKWLIKDYKIKIVMSSYNLVKCSISIDNTGDKKEKGIFGTNGIADFFYSINIFRRRIVLL